MSLTSDVSRNIYTGDGATAIYAYSYRIFLNSDLSVKVQDTLGSETTLVLDTDYSVSGAGNSSGGNVTLINASQAWLTGGFLTTSYTITISRERPFTQETDIRNQGSFDRASYEDALDHNVMLAQQLNETNNRALRLPTTETPTDAKVTLPTVSDRSDKMLGFDSSGDPVALTSIPVTGITISTFMETLLDDTSASAGRATLGVTLANLGAVGLTGNESVAGIKTFTDTINFTGAKVNIGESGDQGLLELYPATASKGVIQLKASDQAGDTTLVITNASQSGNRTYTIPDGGGDDTFMLNDASGDKLIKGWIRMNGTGTISIGDSYNVSSIVDNGVGSYQIIWDTDFATTNYACVAMSETFHTLNGAQATTDFIVNTYDSTHTIADTSRISVIAIGDQ